MEMYIEDSSNKDEIDEDGEVLSSYSPEYRNRQYDSLRYDKHDACGGGAIGGDLSVTSEYRRRELSPSAGYSKRETNVAFREEIRREPINNDQVVAVSGKHRCAHCGDELGEDSCL
uniref:Nuclear receptor domain-containing protein n=1 Tax=Angiostrongylus cantonensis TaxID=6313 RepID=A0A0K0D8M8_ANGCA